MSGARERTGRSPRRFTTRVVILCPATESPFAGIIPHSETGDLAPVGPSFSTGWNVTCPAPGFHAYEPHILPAIFPLAFQDTFRNDLGFLNFTVPVLFNLPPLDFLSRIAAYPFRLAVSRRDPIYYPKDAVPFRFVGLSTGISWQTLDENFSSLAYTPGQYDQFFDSVLFHLIDAGFDSTTTAVSGEYVLENFSRPFYQVSFYIGEHLSSESMVRNAGRSSVSTSSSATSRPTGTGPT